MNNMNTTLEIPEGTNALRGERIIDVSEKHRPAEMFDATDWLGEHRDIYHHPRVYDRLDIKDYEVAELMADFANWYYTEKETK